jgi:hypothetical protein
LYRDTNAMEFDMSSKIVQATAKIMETMYDCTDVATMSVSLKETNILILTAVDAFGASQHVGRIPVYHHTTQKNASVVFTVKKLSKILKKTKHLALRFQLLDGISLTVIPANDPTTVLYTEENQHNNLGQQVTESKQTLGVSVDLIMYDLATMVINLCVGNGFVTVITHPEDNMLSLSTATPNGSIIVRKVLNVPIPRVRIVIVTKLLKTLTHSCLSSIKTCTMQLAKGAKYLTFEISFQGCLLKTTLFDQSEFVEPCLLARSGVLVGAPATSDQVFDHEIL